ncbi:MAG: alpha/beta fold hydrolase [Thermodesulfobacteriota bacterium]
MKKRLLYVGGVILAVLVLVYVFRQPLILRVTGIRPFVEDRFAGWVDMGVDEAELDRTLRGIHDPQGDGSGSWVYELSRAAAGHERAAGEADHAGQKETAAREYRKAAIFYYLARFPFVGSPAKEKAYQAHIRCYLKAAESLTPPLHVVRIPFEGKEIVTYLRIPATERPPVVLFTGGVDTWKSDFDQVVEPILQQGLAVMAVDMPGTGESQWPLAPESDRVYARVFEYLKTRPDLDGSRVGVLMLSFGGYFAVRLALTNPDVKAAINVGGPISLCFAPEHIRKVPNVMIKTIARAMRVEKDLPLEELVRKTSPFSLADLLKHPKHRGRLLSINGDQDHLVTIDDLYVISKLGVAQDEWVYKGDGHCAPRNIKDWAPKAAAWLKRSL